MEKWLIPGLAQKIDNMNLEHLVVPESNVLTKQKQKSHSNGVKQDIGDK